MTSSDPPPFLTLRTVTILLAAAFIGLVVAGLAFLSTRSAPGGALAGLTAAGASVVGLHQLIGRAGG
ncbi:hypothetical protein [Kitasatospora viridis]|uniref:Uncharacterized protein n=1 Tax=Kitasatospora viridis TaxID=281105 RepID=A0A561UDB0_9ACTN|nr:hypothetical protein [Kitasatospora viridis]TWF97362.1 hypothetical protein FHX73_111142 [Kitasatospora viridis]